MEGETETGGEDRLAIRRDKRHGQEVDRQIVRRGIARWSGGV